MRTFRVAAAAAAVFTLLTLIPAGSAAAADVSSLAWMAGAWGGEEKGVFTEEHWIEPRGGMMLGVNRAVSGGRAVSFEFLRIESAREGIVYWASPGGKPATPFRLVESGPTRAVFENREHDFPSRVLYWLADGALHARIEGTVQGRPKSLEWTWRPLAAGRKN